MGILGLCTSEYEKYYADLYSKLPGIKVKFRDELSFSGKKYDYKDLSKVWIVNDKNNYIITPMIFNDSSIIKSNYTEVDYAGIYAIGLAELLYLVLSSSIEQDGGDQIRNLAELFDNLCAEQFKTFDDIKSICNAFFDTKISTQYDKTLNLFFSMRTDYSKFAYRHVMRYATLLMVLWLKDPKLFWEIFFEVMYYSLPMYLILLDDLIKREDGTSHLINYWLKKDSDLHFQKIGYSSPDGNTTKYITDCRGVAIYSCLSLYYGFCYNHGFNPSNRTVLSYNNSDAVKYLIIKISECIGNDYQSKFLMGEGLDEPCQFDLRDSYHSDIQKIIYNKHTSDKIPKDLYEDLLLFSYAYQSIDDYVEIKAKSTDVTMHYASVHDIFQTIGYILYNNYFKILASDVSKYEDTIKNLETQNKRLSNELAKTKCKIEDIVNNSTNNSEVDQLNVKITELQRIIDSKTDIIEQLNIENKELNLVISNIYSDDDLDETLDEEDVSLDQMVTFLNEFKILMVGGRYDLLSSLAKYNWTNLEQFDGRKNLGTSQLTKADFYVLNTKFISHKVTWKVESDVNDSEVIMYYNGTNPEKLIRSCYKFVKEFLEV